MPANVDNQKELGDISTIFADIERIENEVTQKIADTDLDSKNKIVEKKKETERRIVELDKRAEKMISTAKIDGTKDADVEIRKAEVSVDGQIDTLNKKFQAKKDELVELILSSI
jgi:hypothetical protein